MGILRDVGGMNGSWMRKGKQLVRGGGAYKDAEMDKSMEFLSYYMS